MGNEVKMRDCGAGRDGCGSGEEESGEGEAREGDGSEGGGMFLQHFSKFWLAKIFFEICGRSSKYKIILSSIISFHLLFLANLEGILIFSSV